MAKTPSQILELPENKAEFVRYDVNKRTDELKLDNLKTCQTGYKCYSRHMTYDTNCSNMISRD